MVCKVLLGSYIIIFSFSQTKVYVCDVIIHAQANGLYPLFAMLCFVSPPTNVVYQPSLTYAFTKKDNANESYERITIKLPSTVYLMRNSFER